MTPGHTAKPSQEQYNNYNNSSHDGWACGTTVSFLSNATDNAWTSWRRESGLVARSQSVADYYNTSHQRHGARTPPFVLTAVGWFSDHIGPDPQSQCTAIRWAPCRSEMNEQL
jgi:hypothetical protein